MKYSHFLFVLLLTGLVGCKKNSVTGMAGELELNLNGCGGAKKLAGNRANSTICFTKLITDSRCPTGAVCVWSGYAQCEFSLNLDGEQKSFRLATIKNMLLNTDTIINGYKVSLINVLPYPDIHKNTTETYQAILKLEQK